MDFRVPELGEGVYEAELVAWKVKPGDAVKRGHTLMEVLTDKATMEVPAAFAGTIRKLEAEPGQQIKVGEVVLAYDPAGPGPGQPADQPLATRQTAAAVVAGDGAKERPAATPSGRRAAPTNRLADALVVKAAPSVRLLARKLGIDLSRVEGSGPQGRVLVEDLTHDLEPGRRAQRPQREEPKFEVGKPGTRIKLQGIRRKIAEHMVQAKRTIPHYSYVDECDVSELVRVRAGVRDVYQRKGVKLTYLAFLVKAVVGALKDVPLANASLDEAAGEIVLHDRYHIGIAVAAPAGLIVPVVHDADHKDLLEIAREIERLSNEARAGKTRLEDLRGGTFTITSIGNLGGLFSTPIINYPEVGILGVGKIVKRPAFDAQGHVRPADFVYLSFSFDHRVVDGAIGAVFGNAVIQRLANPVALLVEEGEPGA